MARILHGNVRAADDGRKYFLSGNQDLCMKVRGHQNKIVTNGTDCVELGLVMVDRLGPLAAMESLAKAADLYNKHAAPHDPRRAPPMRSEGEGGVTIPVGKQKGGDVPESLKLGAPTETPIAPISGETTTQSSKSVGSGHVDTFKAEEEEDANPPASTSPKKQVTTLPDSKGLRKKKQKVEDEGPDPFANPI